MKTVIATATGWHGDRLRYEGQEFDIPDDEKLASWMVPKGKPMPAPLKPFVRTVKELQAQASPESALGTLSGQERRKAMADEKRREARTEAAPPASKPA